MTIDTDLLVGAVIGSLALLLVLGAYLTFRLVVILRKLGPACTETVGWDVSEVRLSTISGAWSLFVFVWSRAATPAVVEPRAVHAVPSATSSGTVLATPLTKAS